MNRKTITLFLILSIIGFFVGFYMLKYYECGYSISCFKLINKSKALFYSMPALALVFLILLFTPKAIPIWKKFARWFIPIATIIFISYKGPGAFDFLSPYPEEVFKWVSIIYVVVSTLLIAWSYVKKDKDKD